MANQEEQTRPNENKEQGNLGGTSGESEQKATETNSGHKKDPVHNTGDDRMMIDEEGAEIKPDDQV